MSANQYNNNSGCATHKDLSVNPAGSASEYGDPDTIRLPSPPRVPRDMRMPSGVYMPSDPHVPPAPRMPSAPGMPSERRMPTGVGMPLMPPTTAAPVMDETPSTVQSPYYTAGFLRNFLGRNMRVEFLIGTSGALVDRMGVLVEVGASYIVLRPLLTDNLLMCDLYSIKFVTIYE